MLNKRADIGETITWVIATVVVVVILLLSLYASGLVAKYKKLSASEGKVDTGNSLIILGKWSTMQIFSSDLFLNKTELALKINKNYKQEILNWIKEKNE
ncbi:hypothetical protein DRN73_08455 [Candidatus Pacearchaeota archaeon]|nr:MAG: hypothetical protein DRN73_08455 [Candidatus Pacearchaeota archaeon]